MKRRQIVALLLIVSLVAVPVLPAPVTHAAGSPYTERLTAYVAGLDATWFINLGGINASNARIAAVESNPGVSWYNLTAIKATTWTSDFQVFGPQGYNLLPVPFITPQGAFLTVGASSYSAAEAAASQFGSYLLTSFRSISNSSGTFSFFAPLTFNSIVPSTLLSFLPSGVGGFLQPITVTGFVGLLSPMVTLEGQRGSSGFSHNLILGDITPNGLDASSRINLLNYFGQVRTSIQASNKSASSTIAIHVLDGQLVTTDNATVTNDRASFTSSYSLTLKPGAKLFKVNATVIQQPAQLLATRLIDVGVLKTGENMSVTISLTNLANATTLTGIKLSDNWWKGSGIFKLVSGTSNVSVSSLAPLQSVTPTYVLEYTGNATRQLSIPPATVFYSYVAGNSFFSDGSRMNGITISLGADEPVVFAYVAPSGRFGKSVGTPQPLEVTVKNVGTRTATAVDVAGQQVGGLAPDGGSATVTLSASAPSLIDTNVTEAYSVTYTTPEGASVNTTTNALSLVFSHAGMKLAMGVLGVNSTVSQLPAGGGSNLNMTLDFANQGSATVSSFTARTALPAGLPCGRVGGVNATCAGGVLSIHYSGVLSQGKEHAWVDFNVTKPESFVFPPVPFSLLTSGYNLTGYSNAQPAPVGVTLSKQFNPSPLFEGTSSQVTLTAANAGPYTAYNATLSSSVDSFDTVSGVGSTSHFSQNLSSGASVTFSYSVTASSSAGSALPSGVTARLIMAGTPFTISRTGAKITIYQPLAATITTSPSSPVEGSEFTISVTVSNPSSANVTSVQFLLPVPAGVTLSHPQNANLASGGVSISVPQLAAGSTYNAQVNATAGSGQTIPFSSAKFTFGYAGVTINGRLPPTGIAIGENVLTRYELPMGLVILALLATAFYVRRMVGASAPSSQK